MKRFVIIFLIVLFDFSIYAEDSISTPRSVLQLNFENGIDFIRNDILKQNYGTQSKYFYGIGLQIGHPDNFKMIPFIQFIFSSFEIEKNVSPTLKADSALTTKQFIGGLIFPIYKIGKSYLRVRFGYSYSIVKESFFNIDSESHGFQIGFGIDRKLIANSRIYFDLTYNYQKTKKSQFRDFDMTRFSIGVAL